MTNAANMSPNRRMPPAGTREITAGDRSIAFLIFGFLLACYLFTYTGVIQSSDGLSMFAVAESVVRRGELDTNQLLWMGVQQGDFGPSGDLFSRKGVGMALLALPLVWLARIWSIVGLVQAALLLNPILTAWTGALLYRTGRRLAWARGTSIATALIFGLGTLAWPYTQTFFSDPVCGWGLFAAAYGLLGFAQTGRKRYLLGGGLAWGLAYLARVINLVTLPIYVVGLIFVLRSNARHEQGEVPPWRTLIRQNLRPLISFAIPIVLAGLASLWWNWVRFGGLFTTGYAETERFDALWWFGVVGQIIGPARGLVWYSPVLLLAIPGGVWFWRHDRRIFWLNTAIIVLYFLLYGKWYMWHGGYSWGPRFVVPLMPFLALFAGAGWKRLVDERRRGRAGMAGSYALFGISIAVQWLGLLVPFGLVQDALVAQVQPLFAPETFTQLRYSPLVMQWQFLTPDAIHLAWWQATRTAGRVAWLGLLAPLAGMVTGVLLLRRQLRQDETSAVAEPSRNWLYGAGLMVIALAILTYYQPFLSDADNRAVTAAIATGEQRGDAVLHLIPEQTQQFANVYHGRLPTLGLFAQDELDAGNQEWLARIRRDYRRVWVVPDYAAPEQSGWERALRTDDFTLLDTRPAGSQGRRVALYAVTDAYALTQVGLGTVFGDPAQDGPVTAQNGWFRLDGYAVTDNVTVGDALLLSLAWRSLQPVDYDYQVFVHLLDAQGHKVAQRDGQPVQWLRPTSTWQPGEEISDRYGILLSADIVPGTYTVAVGLYDPVTGQRLPVSAGPQDFAIEIGPIAVSR